MSAKRKQSFYPSDTSQRDAQVMEMKFKAAASLKPSTPTQKVLLKKLRQQHHDITLITGPAGTGKTYLATRVAIEKFQAGEISKIIITRPNVSTGDDLGYLPGTLTEKMAPWTRPIIDVFAECFPMFEVQRLIASEEIEIAPLAYMRGRTFKNAYVIADEAQNCTPEQMKMLLTRIGENCRMVVTGDTEQYDRRELGTASGLQDFVERLQAQRAEATALPAFITGEDDTPAEPEHRWTRIGLVQFGYKDVVRHPVVSEVLKLYA